MKKTQRLLKEAHRRTVIGIRREDPTRIWERRAPLTPDAVYELVREGKVNKDKDNKHSKGRQGGVEVQVVSCSRRVFVDGEYERAGARIVSHLSSPDIVLGVKEPPLDELDEIVGGRDRVGRVGGEVRSLIETHERGGAGRGAGGESESGRQAEREGREGRERREQEQTHIMFSHTIKGQKYNMPLLGRFLDPAFSSSSPSASASPSPSALSTAGSAGSSHSSGSLGTSTPGLSGVRGEARSLKPKPRLRLVDYELLKEGGKRSVGFGWFAGAAGVLEAFSAMAQSHLEKGIASPFLYASRPYTHRSLDEFKRTLRSIGSMIVDREKGVPEGLGPFVVGVSGTGNVSQGALDMLSELPVRKVGVEALEGLVLSSNWDRHTIYLVHAKPQDYLFRMDKGRYERKDYYENPGAYESLFWEKVAPYLTLFINGAGWAPGFPRLMSNVQLAKTLDMVRNRGIGGFRFENVADVSCDVEGGLEYLSRATTLSAPFYDIDVNGLVSASANTANTSSLIMKNLPSVRMMSVDILPASMPLDASKHFSKALGPYLRDLVGEYRYDGDFKLDGSKEKHGQLSGSGGYEGEYTQALRDATIARDGRLRGEWEGLLWDGVKEFAGAPFVGSGSGASASAGVTDEAVGDEVVVEKSANASAKVAASEEEDHPHSHGKTQGKGEPEETSTKTRGGGSGGGEKKRVLLLGSGMVAQPAVDYLVAKLGVKLVIASNSAYELDNLSRPYKTLGDVETVQMEFDDPKKYEHLVRDADVVVSLLPAFMHVNVAKVCIEAKKHLVTASYMSPDMEALNDKAKNANTLILTEIGLDPGIDHLSAMSMVDDLVRQKRKRLLSFISMCGGLPAPEDSIGVPLRYKFSWRPEGVLNAALEGARWLLWKNNHEIPGTELLKNYWSGLPITKEFELEGLPNRDSETYRKLYKLDGMRTFVRGTLRYPGYSSLMSSFVSLGLLNNQKKMNLEGWNTFVRQAMVVQYEQDVQKSGGVLPSLPSLLAASAKGNGVGVTKEQEQERFEQLREALEWLGLALPGMHHAKGMAMPPLPKGPQTPLSIFAYLLAEKLRYASGEKDMVVLSHEIVADDMFNFRAGDGAGKKAISTEEEVHTSTLITYATDRMHVGFEGERPASAMARTVGLPAAVAAGLIVYGKIGGRGGVMRPVDKAVYVPVLKELGEMGLEMDEKVRVVKKLDENSGTVERCLASNVEGEQEFVKKIREERDMHDDPGWVEEESVAWVGDNSSRRKSFTT